MFICKKLWSSWLLIMIVSEGPPGSNGGCPRKLDEETVARMCYNSEASGSTVYIDTSGAKATENLPASVCQCSVRFHNSKLLHVNSTGSLQHCGSVIEFNRTSQESLFTGQDCTVYTTSLDLDWPSDNMMISLHKRESPYHSDFCVSLDLVHCDLDTQYQCKGGNCISKKDVCNSFPDCDHEDDETECEGACAEGQLSCNDGSGCYKHSERCDNITTCSDGSDEIGCTHSQTSGIAITTKEPPVTTPLIQVTCTESKRFSTTTTTTTTTTTSTTTPSTTTTTASTTTSSVPTTITSSVTKSTSTAPVTSTGRHQISSSTSTTAAQNLSTTQSRNETQISTGISSTHTYNGNTSDRNTASNNKENDSVRFGESATFTAPKGEEGIAEKIKDPYVIMAMVIGAIFLASVSGFIIYSVVKRRRKPKSETPDLWIPNTDEELKPMNT